ncbi:MAG: hypothetical protein NTY46_03890 [Candidatus Sumerlaeota bacterium]|nr:hypothetical protein [Candidatus Sumerlaeota bacterium]
MIRKSRTIFHVLGAACITITAPIIISQPRCLAATADGYENPPKTPVSKILPPSMLQGKTYRVMDKADSAGMLYSLSLWTPFGWYYPHSLAMLKIRIAESQALETLQNMRNDPLFLQGLVDYTAGTINDTGKALFNPLQTIGRIPLGLEKFGHSIQARVNEGVVQGETGNLLNMEAKRKLVYNLGVDPYTDNPQLQNALNTVASHQNSGALIAKVAQSFIPGGVGIAVSAATLNSNIQSKLRDNSAPELQEANRRALLQLGCGIAQVNNLLYAKGYTVTRSTAITDAMTELSGVREICQFLAFISTDNIPEITLYEQMQIQMAAGYNKRIKAITRLDILSNTPVFTDISGERHVFAPLDILYWGPLLDERLTKTKADGEKGTAHLWITGTATDLAKSKLKEHTVTLHEKAENVINEK